MDLNVLPECYVDTKLVKALVPPKKGYNHQKGTNVLKRMNEQLPNEFALGIVDEDVQDRAYAQLFEVIWQLPGSLKLLKHPRRHHYLIYLCPAIEKWIIARAEEANITLAEFGLPHDFDKLRKISKTSKSEESDPYSDNFRRLFRALQKSNTHCIVIVSFWINHLKANPYIVNIDWLIQETDRLLAE